MTTWNEDHAATYDRAAEAYAEKFFRELEHKPFDREQLQAFTRGLRGPGPVCDLGCGPGHIAAYLASLGVEAFGLDLSARMIASARMRSPKIPFEVGDLLAIEHAPGSWSGWAAFYSLIHIPGQSLPGVLDDLARLLAP